MLKLKRKILVIMLVFLLSIAVVFSIGNFGKVKAEFSGFEFEYGASIRLTSGTVEGTDIENGIRFRVLMDETHKNKIVNNDNVNLYVVIGPTAYFTGDTKTDWETIRADSHILVDESTIYTPSDENDSAYGKWCANAVLMNVTEKNFKLGLQAIAVIVDEDEATNNEYATVSAERSLYEVVNKAFLDADDENCENARAILNNKGTNYKNWFATANFPIEVETAEQYSQLAKILNTKDGEANIFEVDNETKIVVPTAIVENADKETKNLIEAGLGENTTAISKKYTVTFNTNGGNAINPIEVEENTLASKIYENYVPTKDGYTFIGWYVGDNKVQLSDKITANVTYSAKYIHVFEGAKYISMDNESTNDVGVYLYDTTGYSVEHSAELAPDGKPYSIFTNIKGQIKGDVEGEDLGLDGIVNLYLKENSFTPVKPAKMYFWVYNPGDVTLNIYMQVTTGYWTYNIPNGIITDLVNVSGKGWHYVELGLLDGFTDWDLKSVTTVATTRLVIANNNGWKWGENENYSVKVSNIYLSKIMTGVKDLEILQGTNQVDYLNNVAYYNYEKTQPDTVTVDSSNVDLTKSGEYTISYKVNESVIKTATVKVYSLFDDVTFDICDQEYAEEITIPSYTYTGNRENVTLELSVTDEDNNPITLTNNKFNPNGKHLFKLTLMVKESGALVESKGYTLKLHENVFAWASSSINGQILDANYTTEYTHEGDCGSLVLTSQNNVVDTYFAPITSNPWDDATQSMKIKFYVKNTTGKELSVDLMTRNGYWINRFSRPYYMNDVSQVISNGNEWQEVIITISNNFTDKAFTSITSTAETYLRFGTSDGSNFGGNIYVSNIYSVITPSSNPVSINETKHQSSGAKNYPMTLANASSTDLRYSFAYSMKQGANDIDMGDFVNNGYSFTPTTAGTFIYTITSLFNGVAFNTKDYVITVVEEPYVLNVSDYYGYDDTTKKVTLPQVTFFLDGLTAKYYVTDLSNNETELGNEMVYTVQTGQGAYGYKVDVYDGDSKIATLNKLLNIHPSNVYFDFGDAGRDITNSIKVISGTIVSKDTTNYVSGESCSLKMDNTNFNEKANFQIQLGANASNCDLIRLKVKFVSDEPMYAAIYSASTWQYSSYTIDGNHYTDWSAHILGDGEWHEVEIFLFNTSGTRVSGDDIRVMFQASGYAFNGPEPVMYISNIYGVKY